MPTIATTAGLLRMRPRDPGEPHRTASSLELFFDLTFVVAVSVAAEELLSAESHHAGFGVLQYVLAFFAIWWAWMNFTWFASAFDTDDWLYRVLTVLQMAGVLVLAAGIDRAFTHQDYGVMVVGYVIMRLAMVSQWLRAARNPEYRGTALRYAVGIAAVQVLWVLWLMVPQDLAIAGFLVLVPLELLIPAVGERVRVTPFHLHHVGERYGLFTLIVLGEGMLAITNTLIDAQENHERTADLVLLGVTALVLITGMWWVYFSREPHLALTSFRATFAFGYVHYVVFAAAGAFAAGIELGVESDGVHHPLPEPVVRAATTVPVALFLLATWIVILRASVGRAAGRAIVALAVLVALAALAPAGLQLAALLVVAAVVLVEVDARRPIGRPPAGSAEEWRR